MYDIDVQKIFGSYIENPTKENDDQLLGMMRIFTIAKAPADIKQLLIILRFFNCEVVKNPKDASIVKTLRQLKEVEKEVVKKLQEFNSNAKWYVGWLSEGQQDYCLWYRPLKK